MVKLSRSSRSSSTARSNTSTRSRSNARKTASYDQTALEITPSPPLTSSLHSRNSATSAQESAYLRRVCLLKWTRLVLSVLTIAFGTALVGCEGHILRAYNATHLGRGWFLPLWPVGIDLKPDVGVLASGAIVILSSLVYIVVAVIPSVR